MTKKDEYLRYVSEEERSLYEEMKNNEKDSEEYYKDYISEYGENPGDLDLMIDDCIKDYRQQCVYLIDRALDRGCDPEDLYPIFGKWMVNVYY